MTPEFCLKLGELVTLVSFLIEDDGNEVPNEARERLRGLCHDVKKGFFASNAKPHPQAQDPRTISSNSFIRDGK